MTTLVENDLFQYLGYLQDELEKTKSGENKGSILYETHLQLQKIIQTETLFLEKYYANNGNKPMLTFSGNGLPSIESLSADLEAICNLDDSDLVSGISGFQKKGIPEENGFSYDSYKKISESEWKKEYKSYTENSLSEKSRFSIREAEDGKLELSLKKELYSRGIDKYSTQFPVIFRQSRTNYQIAFNRLFSETDEEYFSLKKDIVLSKNTQGNKVTLFDSAKHLSIGAYSVCKGTIKRTPSFLKGVFDGHFRVPTVLRRVNEKNLSYNIGAIAPILGTVVWGIYPIASYSFLFNTFGSSIPLSLLATQLTTNLLSGLYEIGRHLSLKNQKQKEIKLADEKKLIEEIKNDNSN